MASTQNGTIDKWWATAGAADIPVTWNVSVEEASDKYYLAINVGGNQTWKIKDGSKIKVKSLNGENDIELSPNSRNEYFLGKLNPGNYQVEISNFDVPDTPVVEEISFVLKTLHGNDSVTVIEKQLDTLFIADNPDLYTYNIKEQQIDLTTGEEIEVDIPLSSEQLIDYFAPILHFDAGIIQNSDDGERYAVPVDVSETWGNNNNWKTAIDNGQVTEPRTITGNSTDYLDLSSLENQKFFPNNGYANQAVYASVVQNNADSKYNGEIAINYYFHYPRSNWKEYDGRNTHEGDWEGITVFLSNGKPVRVAYAQHVSVSNLSDYGGQTLDWEYVEREGNRPKVYVGLGGHASYPFPGVTDVGTTITRYKKEFHKGDYVIYNPSSDDVKYLPRAGSIDKNDVANNWLLYPGKWGVPDLNGDGVTVLGDSAPRGPMFLDTALNVTTTGAGARWLDPWQASENFAQLKTSSQLEEIIKAPDNSNLKYFQENKTTMVVGQSSGVWEIDATQSSKDKSTTIIGATGNDTYKIIGDDSNSTNTFFISDRGGDNDVLEITENYTFPELIQLNTNVFNSL